MVTRTKKYQRRQKGEGVLVVNEPRREFVFAEESEEEEEEEESEDGDEELTASWSPERWWPPVLKHWYACFKALRKVEETPRSFPFPLPH